MPTRTFGLRPLGTSGCLSSSIVLTASKLPSIPQTRHLKPHRKWRIRTSAAHARLDNSPTVAFVPTPHSGLSAPCMYFVSYSPKVAPVLYRLVSRPWSAARYPLHLRRNKHTICLTPFQMLLAVLRTHHSIEHAQAHMQRFHTYVTVQLTLKSKKRD